MVEFIECPMLRKRLSIGVCRACPMGYHGGVQAQIQIEEIGPNGGCASSRVEFVPADDVATLVATQPRSQITVQNHLLLCNFPRMLPIETVE